MRCHFSLEIETVKKSNEIAIKENTITEVKISFGEPISRFNTKKEYEKKIAELHPLMHCI